MKCRIDSVKNSSIITVRPYILDFTKFQNFDKIVLFTLILKRVMSLYIEFQHLIKQPYFVYCFRKK